MCVGQQLGATRWAVHHTTSWAVHPTAAATKQRPSPAGVRGGDVRIVQPGESANHRHAVAAGGQEAGLLLQHLRLAQLLPKIKKQASTVGSAKPASDGQCARFRAKHPPVPMLRCMHSIGAPWAGITSMESSASSHLGHGRGHTTQSLNCSRPWLHIGCGWRHRRGIVADAANVARAVWPGVHLRLQ